MIVRTDRLFISIEVVAQDEFPIDQEALYWLLREVLSAQLPERATYSVDMYLPSGVVTLDSQC